MQNDFRQPKIVWRIKMSCSILLQHLQLVLPKQCQTRIQSPTHPPPSPSPFRALRSRKRQNSGQRLDSQSEGSVTLFGGKWTRFWHGRLGVRMRYNILVWVRSFRPGYKNASYHLRVCSRQSFTDQIIFIRSDGLRRTDHKRVGNYVLRPYIFTHVTIKHMSDKLLIFILALINLSVPAVSYYCKYDLRASFKSEISQLIDFNST